MSQLDDLLDEIELPLAGRRAGKVRVSWDLPNDSEGPRRLFVTTDRLSAFDRVLRCVPGKGQMLNELSWWWFRELSSVIPNHAISMPDPNVLVARSATPLSVEVIVRRAITGVTTTSLWQRYDSGARVLDGHRLPDGLRKNDLLPSPLITPTTKAEAGGHDEPLSESDVVTQNLVSAPIWEIVRESALALFNRGEQVAQAAGLVLADTKYEFGIDAQGQVLLIDEVHTPDSSRYWERSTFEARQRLGQEPESMDKEIVRRAYADRGYRGDGTPPVLSESVWESVARGYRRAFERLTGAPLQPVEPPTRQRIIRALTMRGILKEGN